MKLMYLVFRHQYLALSGTKGSRNVDSELPGRLAILIRLQTANGHKTVESFVAEKAA